MSISNVSPVSDPLHTQAQSPMQTQQSVAEHMFHSDSYTREEIEHHRPLLSREEVVKRAIHQRLQHVQNVAQNNNSKKSKARSKLIVNDITQFHRTHLNRRSEASHRFEATINLKKFRESVSYLYQKLGALSPGVISHRPSDMTNYHTDRLKLLRQVLKDNYYLTSAERQEIRAPWFRW